jgi:methylphosphotriester-DNA--protein-cysteine methyltransferase
VSDYEFVADVIRHLDQDHETQPSLTELAGAVGLSPFHFHRVFHRRGTDRKRAMLGWERSRSRKPALFPASGAGC